MTPTVPRREIVPFFSDCVAWPTELLRVLEYLVDEGFQITRSDFQHFTGSQHPPDESDWHVTYWRLPGRPIFWWVHSATEYVFADEASLRDVEAMLDERE